MSNLTPSQFLSPNEWTQIGQNSPIPDTGGKSFKDAIGFNDMLNETIKGRLLAMVVQNPKTEKERVINMLCEELYKDFNPDYNADNLTSVKNAPSEYYNNVSGSWKSSLGYKEDISEEDIRADLREKQILARKSQGLSLDEEKIEKAVEKQITRAREKTGEVKRSQQEYSEDSQNLLIQLSQMRNITVPTYLSFPGHGKTSCSREADAVFAERMQKAFERLKKKHPKLMKEYDMMHVTTANFESQKEKLYELKDDPEKKAKTILLGYHEFFVGGLAEGGGIVGEQVPVMSDNNSVVIKEILPEFTLLANQGLFDSTYIVLDELLAMKSEAQARFLQKLFVTDNAPGFYIIALSNFGASVDNTTKFNHNAAFGARLEKKIFLTKGIEAFNYVRNLLDNNPVTRHLGGLGLENVFRSLENFFYWVPTDASNTNTVSPRNLAEKIKRFIQNVTEDYVCNGDLVKSVKVAAEQMETDKSYLPVNISRHLAAHITNYTSVAWSLSKSLTEVATKDFNLKQEVDKDGKTWVDVIAENKSSATALGAADAGLFQNQLLGALTDNFIRQIREDNEDIMEEFFEENPEKSRTEYQTLVGSEKAKAIFKVIIQSVINCDNDQKNALVSGLMKELARSFPDMLNKDGKDSYERGMQPSNVMSSEAVTRVLQDNFISLINDEVGIIDKMQAARTEKEKNELSKQLIGITQSGVNDFLSYFSKNGISPQTIEKIKEESDGIIKGLNEEHKGETPRNNRGKTADVEQDDTDVKKATRNGARMRNGT